MDLNEIAQLKGAMDTDAIMFRSLIRGGVKDVIDGGVYVGDSRPLNSTKEDVVVNTIDVQADSFPQVATTNVNIFVPDMEATIDGRLQVVANRERLKLISAVVRNIVNTMRVDGVKFYVTNEVVLNEQSLNQHYVNLRISWNIQN